MTEHPKASEIQLYKDTAGEWRFNGLAANGRIVVSSSEGYINREDAVGAAQGMLGDDVPVVELQPKNEGS